MSGANNGLPPHPPALVPDPSALDPQPRGAKVKAALKSTLRGQVTFGNGALWLPTRDSHMA